jgi:Ca2+:H+ antiporter
MVEPVEDGESIRWAGVLAAIDPRESKMNWLLLAIPVAIWLSLVEHNQPMAFITSMVAIMPLAYIMGRATEEFALRTSESVGGLLNATFGNAAELIICVLAIVAAATALSNGDPESAATLVHVVQASLIGSILSNLLLVLGLAFVWGGIHHKVQKFNPGQVGANGSLLLLAVIALILPTAYHMTGDADADVLSANALKLSHATAVVLLLLYGLFLIFQLRTHTDLFATDGTHEDEEPTMRKREAMLLLVAATALIALMAEILVHSIESAGEEWGMPTVFIGVILLPLFGNAAEHFTAVAVAGKDKMDLSFAIAVGSSTQIAIFVAPLMVLFAWAMGVSLSFEFGLLETIATFLAVLITNAIAADGKSNWLEGTMLLVTYALLAMTFSLG